MQITEIKKSEALTQTLQYVCICIKYDFYIK